MTSPTVSVVIPTYNRVDWIKSTINSVDAQTYSNILEIIVVDDGSNDGTVELLSSFRSDIKVIQNVINKGACFSRNIGGNTAKGDYIAFLDSDDVFNADKIETQINAILKAGAIASTCAFQDNEKQYYLDKYIPSDKIERILRYRNCLGGSSAIIVKRDVFSKFEFDEGMEATQDWEFLYRLSKTEVIIHVPKPLYIQEMNSNDRITLNAEKRYLGHKQIYKKHFKKYLISRIVFRPLLKFLYYEKMNNEKEAKFYRKIYSIALKLANFIEVT